jgi:hypothetical protein
MRNLIPTSEMMIPEEIERVASKTILLKGLLELALWERTMREGHEQYMTTIDLMDVVVWRKKGENLAWVCTQARWLQADKIDQFEAYLRDHGFVGKRIDDDEHHTIIFHQRRARLHVHLLRHLSREDSDYLEIEKLADHFPGLNTDDRV